MAGPQIAPSHHLGSSPLNYKTAEGAVHLWRSRLHIKLCLIGNGFYVSDFWECPATAECRPRWSGFKDDPAVQDDGT
jgi:hypothetical protein